MLSSGISQESSQMIPTPGLNTPQHMSVNSEYSHGGGLSSIDSTMVSQPQQKQFVESQNSRMLQNLGGQRGAGMRSNMQHKTSTYGLPNGVLSGGLGLIGSNMQMVNGLEALEGYPSTASYGSSPKPLHQHFDRQHHQQEVPSNHLYYSYLVILYLMWHACSLFFHLCVSPSSFALYLVDYFVSVVRFLPSCLALLYSIIVSSVVAYGWSISKCS